MKHKKINLKLVWAGWFDKFKRRTGIHFVVRHGEATSSDVKSEEFYKNVVEVIEPGGFKPQQCCCFEVIENTNFTL